MKTFQLKVVTLLMAAFAANYQASAQVANPATDIQIDSHVKAFLKVLDAPGAKPIETMTPVEARAVLTAAQNSVKFDYSDITVAEKVISEDGIKVKITIVKPAGAKGTLPVFMFFHGGGWVLGDFPTHKRIVRDLVKYSGAAAVFVNYTPSPEAHYPVAINQDYAATKWVAAHGKEINVDGTRLAVAGNSVGGNMAAVISLMAKDKKGPKIKLQVLLWPVTDANFETESYKKYATGRFLTRNMMIWFWDNYAKDPAERKQIYASPLQATLAELKGLPPAVVEFAENDVLHDEGLAYARKLDEAGVRVTSVQYNGMIHDWGLLNPLATVPATQSALMQAGSEIKKSLAKK